ncbi:TVP38/TMEM64 family protein [Cohnella boryungensis]|uniref:TVP38/TMEM64 family membrane protein n=1 Tax=Cohnella boryungensis TaxID=768479 RepID=A0ABV8SF50_9BACL
MRLEDVEDARIPSPLPLWKRGLSVLVYTAVIASIILFRSEIMLWLDRISEVNPLVVVAAATVLALVPVIPFPLIGGALGAAFGSGLGAIYTWTGSTLASLLMFLLVRSLFLDWGQRLLHKTKAISKMTGWFEQNSFLFITATRMIPFIPSIVVNVYCALNRVGFWPYAIASSLGKIPAMVLFAILGNQLLNEPSGMLLTVAVYAGFILLVYVGYFKIYVRRSAE